MLFLIVPTLTACSVAPKPYTEIKLQKVDDFMYAGEQEAFSGANLLAKKGRELPRQRLSQKDFGSTIQDLRKRTDFCHQYASRCKQEQGWACLCEVYEDGKRMFVASTNGNLQNQDLKEYEWQFYEGQKVLFRAPMEYGADGPIRRVEMVEGKPAVTFFRALSVPTSDQELPAVTSDVFYDGQFFNERYDVDGSHAAFSYQGKIGFVGTLNGKDYIFFDGKPVSQAFDAIRTEACCAVPATSLRLFDNGALVFVGERDGYGVLTEIDLNSPWFRGKVVDVVTSPSKKATLEDVIPLGNHILAQYQQWGKCGDVLGALGRKPDHLAFVECRSSTGQELFMATYTVPGADAASVEESLVQSFGMAPLQFLCCGWEVANQETGQAYLGNSRFLTVEMHSDESLINERAKWSEIPLFHVTVEFVST